MVESHKIDVTKMEEVALPYLIQIAVDEPDIKLFGLQVVSKLFAIGLLCHKDEHGTCNERSSWMKSRGDKFLWQHLKSQNEES